MCVCVYVYVYIMEYYSAIKSKILVFATTQMEQENIMLSEIKTNMWYHLYVESAKLYKWIYIQNRNRVIGKQTCGYQRGWGAGTNWGYRINIYKLLYIKEVSNKDLLCSTGNYTHYLIITYGSSDGKASACSAGDLGSIPGSGRPIGEGNGNPFQYSCLENSMDGGAW